MNGRLIICGYIFMFDKGKKERKEHVLLVLRGLVRGIKMPVYSMCVGRRVSKSDKKCQYIIVWGIQKL
jgi:hypothetical protein